jgi:hypothetical protein
MYGERYVGDVVVVNNSWNRELLEVDAAFKRETRQGTAQHFLSQPSNDAASLPLQPPAESWSC